jgi:hypothetical protein
MSGAPTMSPAQESALVDALADALEQLLDRSCMEMVPLWFHATRRARELLPSMQPRSEFESSPHLLAASKSTISKYGALAAWRHAVLWQRSRDALDADDRAVIDAIYFTPCPNRPPFAWSQSAAACPALPPGANPSWVKERARDVAEVLLNALRAQAERCDGSVRGEVEQKLLGVATRSTLDEVLKITEIMKVRERQDG